MADSDWSLRSYATAAVSCPDCEDVIELPIPVDVWITRTSGGDHIGARVDDEAAWQQPVWDHALNAHGPAL